MEPLSAEPLEDVENTHCRFCSAVYAENLELKRTLKSQEEELKALRLDKRVKFSPTDIPEESKGESGEARKVGASTTSSQGEFAERQLNMRKRTNTSTRMESEANSLFSSTAKILFTEASPGFQHELMGSEVLLLKTIQEVKSCVS
jgi:hypothetical protein